MKILIDIHDEDNSHALLLYDDNKQCPDLESFWHDVIKPSIKRLYDTTNNVDPLSLKKTLESDKRFSSLDDKTYDSLLYKECIALYDIEIEIHESVVDFYVMHNDENLGFVTCKSCVFGLDIRGNCIDDFIQRIVSPNVRMMKKLCGYVLSRADDRFTAVEYHQTSCYEEDFAQIMQIKHIASKIANYCDKEAEAISDKYTKLD